eukprot:7385346-Prymnesium_polylepis.2
MAASPLFLLLLLLLLFAWVEAVGALDKPRAPLAARVEGSALRRLSRPSAPRSAGLCGAAPAPDRWPSGPC